MRKAALRVGMISGTAAAVLLGFILSLQGCAWWVTGLLCVALSGWITVTALMLAERIGRALRENPESFSELRSWQMRLAQQEQTLRGNARTLAERERDLAAIQENMSEGLILLDRDGYIVAVNQRARTFLGSTGAEQGKHIFAVSTHPTLRRAVICAQGGEPDEELLELADCSVTVYADPVFLGPQLRGVVLLLVDVSEKLESEALRREFSANVSHELKTPLTVISGYAELLEAGLVQPEDVNGIGGNIRTETARLLSLIDDIIRLSHMDGEYSEPELEPVDLLEIAQEVGRRLQPAAEHYGVTLTVGGESGEIPGNERLLEQLITNLAENALKYNIPGGSADIRVVRENNSLLLTVSDTGIGIAREHQPHVFERFYRVDKSRSKSTGGTGLGLSIVKHAAAALNAEIDLQSRPGKGTSITVRFPMI